MASHGKRRELKVLNAAGFRTKRRSKPKTGSNLKPQPSFSRVSKPTHTRRVKAGIKIDIMSVFEAKIALKSLKAEPESAVTKHLSSLPVPVQSPLKSHANPVTKSQPAFPACDPIRPAFCCGDLIDTPHIANEIANPYSLSIQHLMAFAAKVHSTEATPVKDMAWQGLQFADFILELKRGRVTRQTPVTRRRKSGERGDRKVKAAEEDIEFGPGRYFVQSVEAVEGFVEIMILDLNIPREFENVMGVCKELSCVEHKDIVFQIEVWEGMKGLKKYFK